MEEEDVRRRARSTPASASRRPTRMHEPAQRRLGHPVDPVVVDLGQGADLAGMRPAGPRTGARRSGRPARASRARVGQRVRLGRQPQRRRASAPIAAGLREALCRARPGGGPAPRPTTARPGRRSSGRGGRARRGTPPGRRRERPARLGRRDQVVDRDARSSDQRARRAPASRPPSVAERLEPALDLLQLVDAAADQPERLARRRRPSTTDSYRSARSSRTWYGPRIA